jgi:hypothetical protein
MIDPQVAQDEFREPRRENGVDDQRPSGLTLAFAIAVVTCKEIARGAA